MATVESLSARIDALQQQTAIMHLRQTELENQIRSVGRLWSLMQEHEDLIRPDAACRGGGAEESPQADQDAEPAAQERGPTDEELAAIEQEDLVAGL